MEKWLLSGGGREDTSLGRFTGLGSKEVLRKPQDTEHVQGTQVPTGKGSQWPKLATKCIMTFWIITRSMKCKYVSPHEHVNT